MGASGGPDKDPPEQVSWLTAADPSASEQQPTAEATQVLRVAVPVPLHRTFDYTAPASSSVSPGCRVAVRFAHRPMVALVVEVEPDDPHAEPAPVEAIIDREPLLDAQTLSLAQWLADYYHHPIGEVLETVLPAEARRGSAAERTPVTGYAAIWTDPDQFGQLERAPRQLAALEHLASQGPTSAQVLNRAGFGARIRQALLDRGAIEEITLSSAHAFKPESEHSLNGEQQQAMAAIAAQLQTFGVHLLAGVTGSGKTEVYLQLMRQVVDAGGQVLLLVPEIGLTPQTLQRVRKRFARVEIMHSQETDAARWQAWLATAGGDAEVLVGTRSAVFTPMPRLKMIIIDEEHDSSFKQQDGLRYSARDFAAVRAQRAGIPLILGSATPSVESLHNAAAGRYHSHRLTQRAGGASLPTFRLLDIRGHDLIEGVSPQALHVMRQHLDAKGQVLVFINRRGFAPTLLCRGCGWVAACPDCDARLTLHRAPHGLRCHHCGYGARVPEACATCDSESLIALGFGTQRTEEGLGEHLSHPVLRIDRDTTRSSAVLASNLNTINRGEPLVMVGTQMLAKGHHFPNVTLVVVLNADGGFFSADFRGPERMAQTIVQVAGRAGRAERSGEVWVQTYQPEHPALKRIAQGDYHQFAAEELENRRLAGLPPAQQMAIIRADAFTADEASQFLSQLRAALPRTVSSFGPAPAPIQRISKRHRYQLMLLAPQRRSLHEALRTIRGLSGSRSLRWSIDVDPYDAF